MLKEMDPRFEHFTPEEDAKYLRRAIAVAEAAKAAGNHPFGAVLVDLQGNILMEQGNIEVTEKVCTGHAETTLWNCSLYSSIEPCCMCCGAAYWANLGRIVFAATEKDLLALTGAHPDNPTFSSDCRSILSRGQKAIVVQGPIPALRQEALASHIGYWK